MVVISLMPNYFRVTLCDIFQQFNGREISGCRISVKPKLSQAPTILKILQVLRTGERCSPLQIIRAGLLCRKVASLGALFLPHACVQLWSAMLIPNSSFLTPHLASPCILSAHICIY